jgi:hypothetical protein
MLILAHILGMPLEELMVPVAGGITAGAFAYLVSALTLRTKRR